VKTWQASGKSAAVWCRENEISYSKFNHWKWRFTLPEEEHAPPTKTTFIEIPEDKSVDSGVAIEYQNVRIQLAKQFDHPTLKSLITFLGRF